MYNVQSNAKAIFIAALDCQSPAELAAYLNQACAGESALRSRVEQLLQDHRDAGSFLEQPAPGFDVTQFQPRIAERPGTVIGPYKLLEQIGEGGFGLVFLSEQQQPIRRRVALKILKAGMDTREVITRFEAERQALALMDHRHIAKVLDAGTTDTGRPYFVMELVQGVPITEYCDGCNLTLRERLELFVAVCQAVQHAHQKGIIHRDLKPTNVLVAIEDGKPSPKVIDFGVSKAVNQRLTEHTLHTAFTQMIGSPLYMSPEQAELSPLGVDTRSDIYSLGVLLYELLTGTTPFDSQRFKDASYDELHRIIREEEPPRPSARVSTLGPRAETVAENRRTDTKKLCQMVRGELDWIVMKALEKDRARRYEAASALAADVEHYLVDEPVEACPPSALYRFRKFARRNKWAFFGTSVLAAMMLIIVVVVAGSVGWVSHDRATRQAMLDQQITIALDESRSLYQAGKLTDAMSALQRAEGLLSGGGGSAKTTQAVSHWRSDLATAKRLEDVRLDHSAALMRGDGLPDGELARAYQKELEKYGLEFARIEVENVAQEIRNSPIRPNLVTVLDDWFNLTQPDESAKGRPELLQIAGLADQDPWRNRLRDAIQRADDNALSHLATEKDAVALPVQTLMLLENTLEKRGQHPARLEILRKAQRRHPEDFFINVHLAQCIHKVTPGNFEEIIGFLRVAVAVRPDSAYGYNELGVALANAGKSADAEAAYREAIRLQPSVIVSLLNLSHLLGEQRKFAEAEVLCREVLRQKPKFLNAQNLLAEILVQRSQKTEAEAIAREALEGNPTDHEAHECLAIVLIDMGKFTEGEAECREAIRLKPDSARAHVLLGKALYRHGKYADAEASTLEAIRLDPHNPQYHRNLSALLRAQGKYETAVVEAREAIRLKPDDAESHHELGNVFFAKGKYRDAETAWREAVRLEPDDAVSHGGLAVALERQGKFAEAEPEARDSVRLRPDDLTAQGNLSLALMQQGKYAEAEEFWREVARLQPDNNSAHREIAIAMLKRAETAGETPPWEEAAAEFVKAIDLSEDKRYHGDRFLVCTELARWDEVFNRVVQLRPDDTALWIGRARDRALRSRWPEALADYVKVIHQRPSAGDEITEYAYLLVFLNDVEGFQQFCRELVQRPGEPQDADTAFQMARALAAAPCEVVDPSRLVEWATKAVDANRNAAFLHGLGLAQYRAERYEQSIETLQKSNASNWSDSAKSQNWIVLAMAHHRLGHADEASQCLDTARKTIDHLRPQKSDERVEMWAPDWIPIQVLLREAEVLLTEPALEHKTNTADNR